MTILIAVSGPANTGKSTGIKEAMSIIGVSFPKSGLAKVGDITVVISSYVKSDTVIQKAIGFASGGDHVDIVRDNITFFSSQPMQLDCIVLACRSYGATRVEIEQYAAGLGVNPIVIKSTYPPKSQNIANQILLHIP